MFSKSISGDGGPKRSSRAVLFMIACTVAAVTLGGCASTSSATKPSASSGASANTSGSAHTIKLSMANSNTSSEYKMAQQFGKALSKISGGKLTVDIFPASQLGPVGSEIEGVRSGSIQAIAMSGLDSVIPSVDVAALPYMFTSMDEAQKVLNSSDMQSVLWSKFASFNLKVVGTWPVGDFGIMTTKSGVGSLAALKGERIRVVSPLVSTPLLSAWGVNPTPVDSTQVLTSLSTGLVDGVFDPADPITSQGWQQYGKSFVETDSIYNFNPVVFSQKFLDSLSAGQRADITEAFAQTLPYANTVYAQDKATAIATLKSSGVKIYTPSLASFKSAAKAAEPAWDKSFGAALIKQVRAVAAKQAK
jgi:TRAP-type C4-dicarboxylate transport system substrate-binding protein